MVAFAKEAPVAVIFRTGPRKIIVQTIKWNTADDTFEPGQWLKGSIESASLSPDGRYLIYHAHDYRKGRTKGDYWKQDWLGISKPPYLTALALWFNGPWSGGCFTPDGAAVINTGDKGKLERMTPGCPLKIIDTGPQRRLARSMADYDKIHRLCPDDWERRTEIVEVEVKPDSPAYTWEREQRIAEIKSASVSKLTYSFLRALGVDKPRTAQMHSPTSYLAESEVLRKTFGRTSLKRRDSKFEFSEAPLKFPESWWVDFDHQGRVVYSEAGKLFAAAREHDWQPREIADFTDNEFYEMEPPEWAKEW